MKDVLDIYVISFITKIDVNELRQIWMENDRELGGFEAYRTQIRELNEAYDKMKGVKNKPDFMKVYNQVRDVICELDYQREIETPIKKKSR